MVIKTKKYTTAQITEAIKFWTKILENKSPFLDALVDDFGYDAVFSEKSKITVSLNVIEKIAKISNAIIFNSTLRDVDFSEDYEDKHMTPGAMLGYFFTAWEDPSSGEFNLLLQRGIDKGGNIFLPPTIYVSKQFLGQQMHLVALASVVVHELIHQKIVEEADSDRLEMLVSCQHDMHSEEFLKIANDINAKHGLNVTKYGSFAYDNETVKALKNFVGNDYNESDCEKNKCYRTWKKGNYISVILY